MNLLAVPTQKELENSIKQFLFQHFRFRKIEIYKYIQAETIFFDYDNASKEDFVQSTNISAHVENVRIKNAGRWLELQDKMLETHIWREYRLRCFDFVLREKDKKMFLAIARNIIFNEMIIDFPVIPALKEMLDKGRILISRKEIRENKNGASIKTGRPELNKLYYYCDSPKPPYIANPAFIIKCINNDMCEIIYFTNAKERFSSTSKLNINAWANVSVPYSELGTTPLDAVLNRER